MNAPENTVEFYFEFSSPYAYFASERIEAVCARLGLTVDWRPIVLGPILQRTGQRPLLTDGVRGTYARRDCVRWARLHDIPFHVPSPHPVNSLKAARGALLLKGLPRKAGLLGRGPLDDGQRLPSFIHACFRAYWVHGRDLSQDDVIADLVAGLGMEVEPFRSGISSPAIKERLREETDAAWARGVFGVPTFFFRGEMLWGNDRLPLLERLIQEGRARTA